MRARHALAFVGDTVGLLLLLFLRLLPCRPCRNSELTGRVARIGPCFDVEHGEDFRIRCDPDILSCSRTDATRAVEGLARVRWTLFRRE